MNYEEILEKVVSKLKHERELTRKGHKTKVTFDDHSFTKVRISEICKILLKLKDDEKAVTVLDALQSMETVSTDQIINPSDDEDYENVVVITVELDEVFDAWYENYLMDQKTNLVNLTAINLLRVLDTSQDINEQIQLTHKTTVYINLLPSMIRYRELFPADTIGFRHEYCDHRLDSLKYLKEKSIITDYSHGRNGWDTVITVSFVLSRFEEFYKAIKEEYKKRIQPKDQADSPKTISTNLVQELVWPNDFLWENKTFIFGSYGKTPFQSPDRLRMFKTLTEKKGGWATISELKGNQDAGYVRSTLKQIEDRFPEEAKKHIKIFSTQDDDSDGKPTSGAYRIKILR